MARKRKQQQQQPVAEPPSSPSPSLSRSRSRSVSSSQRPPRGNDEACIVAGQFRLTLRDQDFAAWYVIPRTTVGCIIMLFCYYRFIFSSDSAAVRDKCWHLILQPMSAFGGAMLLWHKYELGWRRNFDIAVITSAIAGAAINCLQVLCDSTVHRALFVAVWMFGTTLFAAGWSVKDWKTAIRLHLTCHFTGYFCQCILFHCASTCAATSS